MGSTDEKEEKMTFEKFSKMTMQQKIAYTLEHRLQANKAQQSMTPAPTGMNAQILTPAPTGKSVQILTPTPSGKGVQVLTPAPSGKGVQALTPAPSGKGVQVLTPAPIGKGVQVLTPAPSGKGVHTLTPPKAQSAGRGAAKEDKKQVYGGSDSAQYEIFSRLPIDYMLNARVTGKSAKDILRDIEAGRVSFGIPWVTKLDTVRQDGGGQTAGQPKPVALGNANDTPRAWAWDKGSSAQTTPEGTSVFGNTPNGNDSQTQAAGDMKNGQTGAANNAQQDYESKLTNGTKEETKGVYDQELGKLYDMKGSQAYDNSAINQQQEKVEKALQAYVGKCTLEELEQMLPQEKAEEKRLFENGLAAYYAPDDFADKKKEADMKMPLQNSKVDVIKKEIARKLVDPSDDMSTEQMKKQESGKEAFHSELSDTLGVGGKEGTNAGEVFDETLDRYRILRQNDVQSRLYNNYYNNSLVDPRLTAANELIDKQPVDVFMPTAKEMADNYGSGLRAAIAGMGAGLTFDLDKLLEKGGEITPKIAQELFKHGNTLNYALYRDGKYYLPSKELYKEIMSTNNPAWYFAGELAGNIITDVAAAAAVKAAAKGGKFLFGKIVDFIKGLKKSDDAAKGAAEVADNVAKQVDNVADAENAMGKTENVVESGGETAEEAAEDAAKAAMSEKTLPSKPLDSQAMPRGPKTKISKNDNSETVRGLTRENESADTLAKKGYDVEQNPKVEGTKEPDYAIEGKIFDCYAPMPQTNPRNVWDVVFKKIDKKQTDRIVMNLSDWEGKTDDLIKQFKEWEIPELKEIIVIEKNGNIFHLLPWED
jgi:hypothetical protein